MCLDNCVNLSVKLASCTFIFNVIKAAFCKPYFTVIQILLEPVSLFCKTWKRPLDFSRD